MSTNESLGSVETSLTPQARFEEYLQNRGKRTTQQRRNLVDHVFRQHDHFDADGLMERLPRKDEDGYVSRPTVYRTLNELVEAGLLRKMELGGRTVFEHDYGYPQHDHLHCTICNKLIEFQSAELIELRDAVGREHQFRVTAHRLIISGVCNDCSRARRRQRRPVDMI